MKNKSESIASVQSYAIHRDEYSIKYGADRDLETSEIYTQVGTVIEVKEVPEEQLKQGKGFFGFRYKYYILSHNKKLSKTTTSENHNNKSELQLKESQGTSSENEDAVRNSLLYWAYSNEKYDSGERVFLNKSGSYITIIGKTGKRSVIVDGEALLEGEPCQIKITSTTGSPTYTPGIIKPGSIGISDTSEIIEEKSKSKSEISCTGKCSDTYTFSAEEIPIISEKEKEDDLDTFEAMEIRGGKKYKTMVKGKVFKKGTYWGGTMEARGNVRVPLYMIPNLKKLCQKFVSWEGNPEKKPLAILSATRTLKEQEFLYNKWLEKERTPKPEWGAKGLTQYNKAALPGSSKHNFAEAIDFKLNILSDDKKRYPKNSSFTRKKYLSEPDNWPKVFKFLMENAQSLKFEWPDWAQTEKDFEGWHWDYKGPKPRKKR